jgi:hypothetical protein
MPNGIMVAWQTLITAAQDYQDNNARMRMVALNFFQNATISALKIWLKRASVIAKPL